MIDYPEDAASQRRRALGPRPTLAQLDALIAELGLAGEAYHPVTLERAWWAEHGAHAPPVERLSDAPPLPVFISTSGPTSYFIAKRRVHLQVFAAWWEGQGRSVIEAEIAAFEALIDEEYSSDRDALAKDLHELGAPPSRSDWRSLWLKWYGTSSPELEPLAVIGLAHGWLDDEEYRRVKARWFAVETHP